MKSITDQARNDIKSKYREQLQKRIIFIVICIAIIVTLAGVSATLGSYKIEVIEVYSFIWDKIVHGTENTGANIVWELRLPRILMAVLAGAGLAVAGTVMQSILRNPLGDPFTLGISSGASLGAAIAIVLGAGIIGGKYLIIGNAFLFSLVPTFVVFTLAFKRKATPETLILAGVAIMYLFSSATSLIIYFSSADALKHAFFWMIGSVDGASWDAIIPVAIILTIFSVPIMWKAKDLNIIASGDETAKSLGINVERTRIVTLGITSLIASAIVAFTGPVGFIGLVAPHLCRMVIGGDNRLLLPASAAAGAVILLLSDTIARTLIAPIILPVGVITNLIGAPLLIYLILRRRKEYW
jgi:iron complex transport system permease protein